MYRSNNVSLRRNLSAVSIIVSLLVVSGSVPAAGEMPAISASTPGEISLFNGHDLSGWRKPAAGTSSTVTEAERANLAVVEPGGIIHISGEPRGYLATEREFTNFNLSLEYRWSDAQTEHLISGLFIRALPGDGIEPTKMYEVEIANVPRESFGTGDFYIIGFDKNSFRSNLARYGQNLGTVAAKFRPPNSPAMSAHDVAAMNEMYRNAWRRASLRTEKKPGQWNRLEVSCVQGTIRVWLNGTLVNEGRNAQVLPGSIALQAEGGAIDFRDIRVVPLPD